MYLIVRIMHPYRGRQLILFVATDLFMFNIFICMCLGTHLERSLNQNYALANHPLVVFFSWPAHYWYSMRKHAPKEQENIYISLPLLLLPPRPAPQRFSFVAGGSLSTRRTHGRTLRAILEPQENAVKKQRGESARNPRQAQIKEKTNTIICLRRIFVYMTRNV